MQEAKRFGVDGAVSDDHGIHREFSADIAQGAWLMGMLTQAQLADLAPLGFAVLGGEVARMRQRFEARSEITAEKVRLLREQTGEGLMHCKKALTSCGGDLSAAAEWLRRQGQAVVRRSRSLLPRRQFDPLPDGALEHAQKREIAEEWYRFEAASLTLTAEQIANRDIPLLRDQLRPVPSLSLMAQHVGNLLREAYEEGYGDGQNSPNGYSSKDKRDKCVADILARESGQ